ncbi:MAG TPA: serine hydrolase [Candidatus Angelobacter sp.]|nr:serine hydrolase [Candidatus Angelobacter sp.]
MPSMYRLFLVSALFLLARPPLMLADDRPASRELTPETVVVSVKYAPNQPPITLTLRQFMKKYNIPGLSVAVIDNYKIAWAKGFGMTAPGGTDPVTPATLFQAGSISKPVAATGALWLVEQGKLALDEEVNQKLTTWKVPENEFTQTEKVTLRRLMSHTAGLTVHGFPGYAVGQPIPTLVQIFNGEKPANTAPIRVDTVPGTKMRYSGGGVTIEQQLMLDVTGQPFPQFMQEAVLTKIGMTDSTYEQPLPAARAAHAATGTRPNFQPVEGKWHIYPEMAAAGLWTTPTDLAKFAIEIALSKHGKANHVLSEKMTREMLTAVPGHPGDESSNVGLGFFLNEKNPDQFGHNGSDEGFQSFLTMFADSGKGLVIMGNADTFFYITPHIVDAVAHAYGKYVRDPAPADQVLMLIENVKGTPAALVYYRQLKTVRPPEYKLDEGSLNTLGYHLMRQKKLDEAIIVFKLNVHEYPNAWNPYDSLGEAYMNAGQKDLAIQNYEKSLALNPNNKNGADMLKRIKGQ